jgi:hypothetical protein
VAPPRAPERDPEAGSARARYFRAYYLAHRERILEKNRRWGAEHKERLAQLRRERRRLRPDERQAPRVCADCGRRTTRALRCRACYARFRYATDPEYRARRLATTRRWSERRARG